MSYHVPVARGEPRQQVLKRTLQILSGFVGCDAGLDLIRWALGAPLKGVFNTYMGTPRLVIQGLLLLAALSVLLAIGVSNYHVMVANQSAHWTRDRELLFWEQRRPGPRQWDGIDLFIHVTLLVVPLLPLTLVLGFWLVNPAQQLFLLVFLVTLIPTQLLGMNLATWALGAKTLLSATLVDTGNGR